MKRLSPVAFLLTVVGFLVVTLTPVSPEQPASAADRFEVSDVMIPTRDGTKLHTLIFTPRNQAGPLPIVIKRTPYGIDESAGNFNSYMKAMAEDGYIFVFQDIRGKFKSEGEFMMQRPSRLRTSGSGEAGSVTDSKAIDEGTEGEEVEFALRGDV